MEEPLTKERFAGRALLKLALAETNEQLDALARDIKIAADPKDPIITIQQRDVLYAVGKLRREELSQ